MTQLLFSKPGALTSYTTAIRESLPPPSDCPVSPNRYTVDFHCIKALQETLSPFHTTEERRQLKTDDSPGPGSYSPIKLPWNGRESVIMGSTDRFPPSKYDTAGIGPTSIGDPWEMRRRQIYNELHTMRPRVDFPKYVSNNVPSVFHSLDIRGFVEGGDRRMYPWTNPGRIYKQPGPEYDTYKIYTNYSNISPIVNFSKMSKRGIVLPRTAGPGPMAYHIKRELNQNGGIFLSKSDDPGQSTQRLLETIMQEAQKYPGPTDYCVPHELGKLSPKACSAPFKSKVPFQGFPPKLFGPTPMTYFRTDMSITDLEYPLWPYPEVEVPQKPPFLNSEERFVKNCPVVSQFPAPNQYYIRGFSDNMWIDSLKHSPVFPNPKLGFLTSAAPRGNKIDYRLDAVSGICRAETIPGVWRNVRPRKGQTFPYHGCLAQSIDSPGPIYDTTLASKVIKGKRDWFNPREWTGTGFNNSGCGRKTHVINTQSPGPVYYIPSFIPGPGGRINMTESRSTIATTPGPGPVQYLHEKTGSMWRATHLGTFNTQLKGVGTLRPSAGGFHSHGPIDDLADTQDGYRRLNNCPEAQMHQQKRSLTAL